MDELIVIENNGKVTQTNHQEWIIVYPVMYFTIWQLK
jgi:hypothetical protein